MSLSIIISRLSAGKSKAVAQVTSELYFGGNDQQGGLHLVMVGHDHAMYDASETVV